MPQPEDKSTTESAGEPLRFAHPFFVAEAPGARAVSPAFGARMLDHIVATLGPVPPTRRDGWFKLSAVIGGPGARAIENSGKISFHLTGDTGVPEGDHETKQVFVADAMARDYDAASPAKSPAFFLHLGDVIYGPSPEGYLDQFYRPYMHYPGKIIAIPGNHDGESAAKLQAFQDYFCATSQVIPKIAGSIFRQTMNQPGAYWCLDAPFVQVVGLYSNNAENPGAITGGAAGTLQKDWLVKTLKRVKAARDTGARKALFFATHHPPYSSGGHSGSAGMLADIDDACQQADILPDAFFSGHAHSIQRYARTVASGGGSKVIPYLVSGCGGHGGQTVLVAPGPKADNPFLAFSYKGWGYTRAEISRHEFTLRSFGVEGGAVKQVDSVTYKL